MNKKTMLGGILLTLIAITGIGLGIALIRRKRTKGTSVKVESPDPNQQAGITLDKVYESFLKEGFVVEDRNDSKEKPKDIIVKLRDRSFWGVYGSLIISSVFIFLFGVVMTIVSLVGQNAYSERKANEVQQETLQKKKIDEKQKALENRRLDELYNRLDSIDTHIKTLKPSKPVASKKKVKK